MKTFKDYPLLQEHAFKLGTILARPAQLLPESVTLEDSALNVMTDLRRVSVVTVKAQTTLDKANARMIRYGVRMLLVLDDADKVVGLLTATDILGEKPMMFLQDMGGTHSDILVRDIMTLHREIEVLKLQDVQAAKVGHVVATLKHAGRQHAIVIEIGNDGNHIVCGVFSSTQIARQLGG